MSAVAGEAMTAPITAAIVIFRAAQWFVPIPLGWILLVIMRGSNWRELEARPTPRQSRGGRGGERTGRRPVPPRLSGPRRRTVAGPARRS